MRVWLIVVLVRVLVGHADTDATRRVGLDPRVKWSVAGSGDTNGRCMALSGPRRGVPLRALSLSLSRF